MVPSTLRRRMLAAAASLFVAAAGLVAVGSPAAAEQVTIPGCYGAGSVIVCQPTVEFVLPVTAETYTTTVPICVGDCYEVPVTLVRTRNQADPHVCVTSKDRAGNENLRHCRPLSGNLPTLEPCPDGYAGYRVGDGNGGVLLNGCARDPGYQITLCTSDGYIGLYVSDRNGNTILDACYSTNLPSVSTCGSIRQYVGVIVYDSNGNEVFSVCVPTEPRYNVGICSAPQVGAYVYDDSGNTVVDGCFTIKDPAFTVELCRIRYGEYGVVVYRDGSPYLNLCFVLASLEWIST